MSGMKRNIRLALLVGLAALIAGATGVLAVAQSTARSAGEKREEAPYRSSIQVPANDDEEESETTEEEDAGKGEERDDERESAKDSAYLKSLARITADQARIAAVASVTGTVRHVSLDNEDGNLVYSVEIETSAGMRDVKVDAGNGAVLHIEQDDER